MISVSPAVILLGRRSIRKTYLSCALHLIPIISSSLFSSLCKDQPFSPPSQAPPVPMKLPFTASAHGRTWQDPYRWMHKTNEPDFVNYLHQENSYAESFMADTNNLQQTLYSEMTSRMPPAISTPPERWGLCEKETISSARLYFDCLTNSDFVEDIVLYNIMIHRARKLDDARRWLDTIETHGLVPNAITYTTLMNAFCEEGNIQAMFELLDEMEARCVIPTHVTYTVIIKVLCKHGKLQESVRLLEDMFSKGMPPDQISYNTVIQSFCKARDFKNAFQLHNQMLLHNLNPDYVTYNILINGLCMCEDLNDADRLFSFLQDQNIRLSKVAYTTLIKAHSVKGDALKATVLFRQMVDMGFEISIRDYSAVVNRLCRRNLTNDAKHFIRMMLSNGVSLDQQITFTMLDSLNQVDDIDSVHELLPTMIKCGLDSG